MVNSCELSLSGKKGIFTNPDSMASIKPKSDTTQGNKLYGVYPEPVK
jgi:hypothetical protein